MNSPAEQQIDQASAPVLTIDGARATIRLNRPREHNRLDPSDLNVLRAQLAEVDAHPAVRVLVLTGTGDKTFCSGYTLTALTDMKTAASDSEATLEQVIDLFEFFRLPTICALNGSVYGGGTDLALACDFRIGVTGSRMVMPAAKIGLHYYPTGMRRYVERLGAAAAKRLFMLGDPLDCDTMRAIGYLDELVAPGELAPRVDAMAATLASNAPVIATMKAHINRLASGVFDAEAIQRDHVASLRSADIREGLAAMKEKRPLNFGGR